MPNLAGLPSPGSRRARRLRLPGALFPGGAVLVLGLLAALSLPSAPAEAAYPGQNGRIACTGDRAPAAPQSPPPGFSRSEIYTMNADGSDQRLVTNDTVLDEEPAFSPDGTKLAFSSERDAIPADLYTMNLDGSEVRRVARRNAVQTAPYFSPDGKRLAFQDGASPAGATSNFNIARIDLDGTGGRLLTHEPVDDTRPQYAPDGRVAFDSHRDALLDDRQLAIRGNFADFELYTADGERGDDSVGGPPETRLTFTVGDPRFPQGGPFTDSAGNPLTVGVNELQIVRDTAPAFSPDGRELVFESTRALPGQALVPVALQKRALAVWKMPATGGEPQFLAKMSDDYFTGRPLRNAGNLAWSPDGTKILYSADVGSGQATDVEVFTMNPDGSDQRRLTNSPGFDGRCDWGPVARPATATPVGPAATGPRVRAARVRRACSSRSFRVRASASGGSRVQRVTAYLNGRRIVSTRRSSFRVRLPAGLRAGRHRLTVVAVDAAGKRTRRVVRFRVCAAQGPRFTG